MEVKRNTIQQTTKQNNMTPQNAIKKLEKNGFKVTVLNATGFNQRIVAENGGRYIISIITQGEGLAIIKIRSINDHDDMQSDYSAGCYCDNVGQAIKQAKLHSEFTIY